MSDLWNDIQADSKLLSRAVSEYRERGIAPAKAEADYKSKMATAMLEARSNNTPVTIIRDLCLGREEVAKARLNRDCAKTLYEACREEINALKLQIRINDSQYAREWGENGRNF